MFIINSLNNFYKKIVNFIFKEEITISDEKGATPTKYTKSMEEIEAGLKARTDELKVMADNNGLSLITNEHITQCISIPGMIEKANDEAAISYLRIVDIKARVEMERRIDAYIRIPMR